MRKFDPENLSLIHVFIACAFACCILWPYFWLNGKIYDYDGARATAIDNDGVVHIQVNNTLFRYAHSGREMSSIKLADFGVGDLFSDLSFNQDNEILLRKGKYETRFLENIAIFFRLSNKKSTTDHNENGLSFCNLNSESCRTFGSEDYDFNRGYFSTIDQNEGSVLVSDASRHSIMKFSATGQLLASNDRHFKFPNEMTIFENQLYLVDTNNKAIKLLELETANFGELITSFATSNPDGVENGHTYPYYIIRAGAYWWVVLLDGNMDKGGVYLYDDNWQYVKSLNLTLNHVPSSMLNVGNEVLISDAEGISVGRYNLSGQFLGPLEHAELNRVLLKNTEQRNFYRLSVRFYAIGVMILLFLATVLAYTIQLRKAKLDVDKNQLSTPATTIDITRVDDDIVWIPKKGMLNTLKKSRQFQHMSFLLLTLVFAITWFYINTYVQSEISEYAVSKLLLAAAMLLCFVLLMSEASRVRLGVLENRLILHDQVSNLTYAASNDTVMYDRHNIAFGKLSIKTPENFHFGYSLAVYTKLVYPILADAQIVSPKAVLLWRMKNEKLRMRNYWIKISLLLVCAVLYLSI